MTNKTIRPARAHRRRSAAAPSSRPAQALPRSPASCRVSACLLPRMRARRAQAGKGRPQVRVHQAHRHGADRDRQGAWLFRRRRPLRRGRAAGELEGAARPRHHRRTRRRPHARRPAARRHHRVRHQGARHHAVLHGPQRQRHHRRQCGLGGDEAVHPEGPGRQARSSDQGRRAQEGGRQVQGGRQALQHGHGVSVVDAQLRTALLARLRRPAIRAFIRRPISPARSWPTCCCR